MNKRVTEVYNDAVQRLHELGSVYCDMNAEMIMHFGPGHIVWEDGNMDDDSIKFCIAQCYNHREGPESMPWEALDVLRASLQSLLELSEDERGLCDVGNLEV